MFVATALCLAKFTYLENDIHTLSVANGYVGQNDEEDLLIFDRRFGYKVDTVHDLLNTWGPDGRLRYLLIELVDVLIYFPSYRGTFLVLTNQLLSTFVARFPSLSFVRRFALLPIVLAMIDFAEDLGQVTFTVVYDRWGDDHDLLTNVYWRYTVVASSWANQAKWWTVRAGSSFLLLVSVLVAVHAVGGALLGGGKVKKQS